MTLPYRVRPKKKAGYVYDQAGWVEVSDITGSLQVVLDRFNNLLQLWQDTGWLELEVYNDGYDTYILGFRPMTDKEKATAKRRSEKAREAAKRRKEKKLAEEKAEYERLKAKFE